MRDNIYCDFCGNIINDESEEVPIIILELANETLLFCDNDDCMRKYINECTLEKYVDYEGNIK